VKARLFVLIARAAVAIPVCGFALKIAQTRGWIDGA
jgi:hypothetical protein